MGKTLIGIVIIVAVAFAWQQGWIQKWFNTAVDSGIESVSKTRQEARKVRPADAPPEEKK
jgi:hypothetical protein